MTGQDQPQDAGTPPQRIALALLQQLLLRVAFPAGALVMAIGLALLTAAWVVGPRLALMERDLARMHAVIEARLVEPYWALDFDLERWQPDRHWAALLRARPCVHAEYTQAGTAYRALYCGAERGGRIRFELADLLEVQQLMAGVPLRWPLDADGQPQIELRMPPAERAQLAAIALLPHDWPEQPQSEAAASRPPPARSAWDRVQVGLDRPLEWLVRAWPAGDRATIPLRLDPQAPARALPEAFVTGFRAAPGHWALAAFLLAVGLVVYGYGLSIAFMDRRPRTRALIGAGLLLLFPLWGGWTGSLLQRHAPDAWKVGRDMAADLASPGEFALQRIDPAEHAELARIPWSGWGNASAYAALIAPLQLRRPEPPPADADAALRAATAQVAARLRQTDDATAQALFEALAQAHHDGRVEVGLLYVEAARELALAPTHAAAVRTAAIRFMRRVALSSTLEPHPGQLAYAARLALWRSLAAFPADPAVANLAASVVTRAEAREREAGAP